MITVDLKAGDVLATNADVLILKHAQARFGVDAEVLAMIEAEGRHVELPKPGEFRFERGVDGVSAAKILFIGVPPLGQFNYKEIRSFARQALSILAAQEPRAEVALMTIHGAGYGLDELEAFGAEIAGLIDAIREGDRPKSLRRVTIVESNTKRAERLDYNLRHLLPSGSIPEMSSSSGVSYSAPAMRAREAGLESAAKPHAFVAMPFIDEMDDVYHYGIQQAVHAAGLLCERADGSAFTGDVLEWVQTRIQTASIVIADLTDANPNVYLEVGYAWGRGIRTVLLTKSTEHLRFDVRGQRCLIYKKIKELEDLLSKELKELNLGA
ncbi:MAG: hypothetical protein WA294_02380 [Acidobacteriaceae bacterium]